MATKKRIRHKKFVKGILCFLCLFVALSFLGALIPIAGASSDASTSMPCCVGKGAGHCDFGIAPKPIPKRTSEPMCGHETSESADDAITIVAEPSHTHSEVSSSQPAARQPHSVSQPCKMDCGACTASATRQQRRERGIVEQISRLTPSLVTHFSFENSQFSFSTNEDWDQISPRGPPAEL